MIKNISYKELTVHILVWLCISIFPLLTAYIELGEVPSELYLRQLIRPVLFYTNYLFFVPYLLCLVTETLSLAKWLNKLE